MNYADRVKETTTATSTATLTLLGSVTGYKPFNSAPLTVGMTRIPVCVVNQSTGEWEAGLYTLTNSTTLTRNQVTSSSNNNQAVTFAAGTKDVICTPLTYQMQRGLVDPDDVGYDIVLMFGQSNMEGNPAWDPVIDFADSRLSQFGGSSADSATYRKIIAGSDPMYMYNGVRTGFVGPCTWFGRSYANSNPSNRRVLLVPVAAGSTAMVGSTWGVGGALYTLAITQANLAIAAALAIYPNSRFVGCVMAQGEADANAGQTQAAYVAACKAVIAGLRAGITGASSSWFIISGMVPEKIAANASTYGAIDLAHKQVCAEVDRALFVAGPSGFASDVHYTAPGIRIQGARLGTAVLAAKVALGSDATAPTSSSAAVANATPTIVTITTSETLDTGFVPATSAFTVGGHTVSGVAVQGGTYTLTVDAFVNGEAARTVAYTQPGANQLRDLAGNLMASFTGLSVTNNVLPTDSTAPTFVSAQVANATPTVIQVTMSETLAAVIPANSTFTASGKTVTGVGIAGAVVSVTVNSAYVNGDVITITYTNPGSGNRLQDAAANMTATFGPSSVTNNVGAAATVPGAPTIGTATAGNATASVPFTAPASNGGSTITSYTATSSPGGITGTLSQAGSGTITVNGLTNDIAYTFTVTATNGVGTSSPSAASNSVSPTASVTYATWNPSDKGTTVGLTNGNLTATKTGGSSGHVSVRSTVSKSSGKWYWENTMQGAPLFMNGVGKAAATLTTFVGGDANGWGYYSSNGNKFNSNASVALGATYAVGDIIGVALDMDAGTLQFFKNGVAQGGTAYTGLTGPMFAMITVNGGAPAGAITTNFGATAFTYTPPSGFVGLTA